MSSFYIINMIKLKSKVVIFCPAYTVISCPWILFPDNGILQICLKQADLLDFFARCSIFLMLPT